MDLSSQRAEAQLFLDYYVLGAGAAGTSEAFPGSRYPGIVLRQPALLDIRPEYTPLPHPLDGTRVTPPNDGPEGPGDYTFLDRCALRGAKVASTGGQLVVSFLFVAVYPPGRFSDVHPSVTGQVTAARPEEVRLPQSLNELNFTARECMSKLEDYLGFEDPEANPNFGFDIQILTLSEFNAIAG
jgi:hypothetical protein